MYIKIVKASGESLSFEVTPAIEFAFESQFNCGYVKRLQTEQRQGDFFWLAWECERRNGRTVPPFGEKYVETLKSVEVDNSDSPNG